MCMRIFYVCYRYIFRMFRLLEAISLKICEASVGRIFFYSSQKHIFHPLLQKVKYHDLVLFFFFVTITFHTFLGLYRAYFSVIIELSTWLIHLQSFSSLSPLRNVLKMARDTMVFVPGTKDDNYTRKLSSFFIFFIPLFCQ